jgi:phosphate transport system substrate-binding protein
MIYLIKKYCILLIPFIGISCNSVHEQKSDSPTSGSISLYADESFLPIVKAEVRAFENLYHQAEIKVQYQPEDVAVMDFLNNKAETIFLSRELTKEEKDFLKNKKISIRTNKIATDAIALIVNSEHSDSLITTSQLEQIFNGTIRTWNQLASDLPKKEIDIIVDKSNSGNLSYLKNKLNLDTKTLNVYAAGSNKEVMEQVKKNKHSIGIIGVNWISDDDDPALHTKLEQLKVLALAEGAEKDPSKFYQPIQDNLIDGKYPLKRPLYLIIKTSKTGLAAGFASFLLSDQGQRIVLKSGLLPAVMPGREIEIN